MKLLTVAEWLFSLGGFMILKSVNFSAVHTIKL